MYEYRCKVLKVVDGDTVDCEIDLGFHIKMVRRIRLFGIDTAEMNAKDELKRRAAKDAKMLVEQSATQIDRIKTQLDKPDSFGRILGTLFFQGSDYSINDLLLKEGLAVEYLK